MYDHELHRGSKHFHRYFLQAFSTEKILKCHDKDCLKLMVNKLLRCQKGEYVRFKNFENKIKFMIFESFASKILKSLIRTNIKNTLLAVMVIN